MKKFLAIFIICFLGTSCLIYVDSTCRESTNEGGLLGLSVKRVDQNRIKVSFLGADGYLNL